MKFTKAKPREDGAKRVEIAIPCIGHQNHVSIDREHGLVRKSAVTDAATSEGAIVSHGVV